MKELNRQKKHLTHSAITAQQAIHTAEEAHLAVQQAQATLNPQEITYAEQKLHSALSYVQQTEKAIGPNISTQLQFDLQNAEKMLQEECYIFGEQS